MTVNDTLSAHEQTHPENLVREERWRRLSRERQDSEEEQQDAEVLGVRHRPGYAVLDTSYAKTLIGRRAMARHVAETGARSRWLPDSAHVRINGVDDRTQQSSSAVELEWRGRKLIHFVAHVVPGNSGLLLSRPDLKALGAKIDLRSDQLHLSNLTVTLKLTTTPA